MKPLPPMQRLAAGLAACIATGSGAVALGPAHGTALQGQALEVTVPLVADRPGASMPECAAAEVFYGDSRVGASQVAAALQSRDGAPSVRVHAATPVSARLVIVYLHLGCGQRSTRKLVLLADATASVGENPSRTGPAAADTDVTPAAAPGLGRDWASAAASASGTQAAGEGASRPRARARLKLQAVSFAPAETLARLRLTDTLSQPAGEEPSARRAAAAALWRVLNAAPEDLLRDGQRIQSLEQEAGGLRASLRRHDVEVAQLRARTEQAEGQRYANPLVYALALWSVVLGALAAFALMRAGRRRPGWWRGRGGAAEPTDFTGFESSMPVPSRRAAAPAQPHQDPDLDTIAHDDRPAAGRARPPLDFELGRTPRR